MTDTEFIRASLDPDEHMFQPITHVTDADTGESYTIRQVSDSAKGGVDWRAGLSWLVRVARLHG